MINAAGEGLLVNVYIDDKKMSSTLFYSQKNVTETLSKSPEKIAVMVGHIKRIIPIYFFDGKVEGKGEKESPSIKHP